MKQINDIIKPSQSEIDFIWKESLSRNYGGKQISLIESRKNMDTFFRKQNNMENNMLEEEVGCRLDSEQEDIPVEELQHENQIQKQKATVICSKISNKADNNDDIDTNSSCLNSQEIQEKQSLTNEISNQFQNYNDYISLESNKKWKKIEDKKGIQFHTILDNETEDISTRVEARFHLPNGTSQLIDYISDVNKKHLYDPMFEKGASMSRYEEEGIELQHWYLKGFAGIVAARHMTLLSKKIEQADGSVQFVAKSIDNFSGEKNLPYSMSGAVRVNVKLAGWVIRKVQNTANEYQVIYMQKSNPNGKLPFFIKKTTPKMALEMVKNLRKIIEKNNLIQ